MRIRGKGIDPVSTPVIMTYEGATLDAREGDTVASAMIDAGVLACRTSPAGDRGVFCGMGVCNECTVEVDGVAGRLACMTPVRQDMRVARQGEVVELSGQAPPDDLPETVLSPDLVVVGAGPSGLAAAAVAAEAGCEVVLLDERGKLGGQYYKQPSPEFTIDESALDHQYQEGRRLIERARRSGVTILDGARVWGAFAPGHLVAASGTHRWVLHPRRLVIATGAYERGVPMPGWTLPGVMTTGAAQTLSRSQQVSPGQRVLVSGNGPLNMQVAAELTRAGVEVVALAELGTIRSPRHAVRGARMLLAAPGLIRDGIGYAATLARARVPYAAASSVVEMRGDSVVREAVVARIGSDGREVEGTRRTYAVDAVCMGFGFLPSNELARMLGCRHHFDEVTGALVVDRDERGRTSLAGVWVVGDSGGVQGAKVARSLGLVAGADVVADLDRAVPTSSRGELRRAQRARRRHARFQDNLQRVFAAPVLTDQLAQQDTIVCRCESLSLGQVSDGVGDPAVSAGAAKRVSRVGMGKCQGRYCGPVTVALAARRTGRAVDDRSGFAPQVPFKPTPISVIAAPRGD